jgi:hypothetical protein
MDGPLSNAWSSNRGWVAWNLSIEFQDLGRAALNRSDLSILTGSLFNETDDAANTPRSIFISATLCIPASIEVNWQLGTLIISGDRYGTFPLQYDGYFGAVQENKRGRKRH